MYLNKLLLKDFGKFNNEQIDLKSGFNVVYGPKHSGKSTIKDFVVGMLYGIDKQRGLGSESDTYEQCKPMDRKGYSGKAYVKDNGTKLLIEREFSRNSKKLNVLDITKGRDISLNNGGSLVGTMFEVDKEAYLNALCIEADGAADAKTLINNLERDMSNISNTGTKNIDKNKTLDNLHEEIKKYDTAEILREEAEIAEKVAKYDEVKKNLNIARAEISKIDQELAIETARRKREAKKLIDTLEAENAEKENQETRKFKETAEDMGDLVSAEEEAAAALEAEKEKEAGSDALDTERDSEANADEEALEGLSKKELKAKKKAEKKVAKAAAKAEKKANKEASGKDDFDDGIKEEDIVEPEDSEDDEKPSDKESVFLDASLFDKLDDIGKQPLHNQIWFILLTGLFVIGVIAAIVYILPFETGVRQLFVICTAIFVVLTIVEGLFANGMIQGDVSTPSEEDFKKVIYELERKTESYQDVEIDMEFAEAFYAEKQIYVEREQKLLAKIAELDAMKEELEVVRAKRRKLEREREAILYAIDMITEISKEIKEYYGYLINDNIADIVNTITDGKYTDAFFNAKMKLYACVGDEEILAETLDYDSARDLCIAVRICLAKLFLKSSMPIVLDDIFKGLEYAKIRNIIQCFKDFQTDQFIFLTSDKSLIDAFAEELLPCNYVELA